MATLDIWQAADVLAPLTGIDLKVEEVEGLRYMLLQLVAHLFKAPYD